MRKNILFIMILSFTIVMIGCNEQFEKENEDLSNNLALQLKAASQANITMQTKS